MHLMHLLPMIGAWFVTLGVLTISQTGPRYTPLSNQDEDWDTV